MSEYKTIAVTGATGFLGGHFVRMYLNHFPATLHAIVRGASLDECRMKIERNMETVHTSYSEPCPIGRYVNSINCIRGNIEQRDLALLPDDIALLQTQNIDEFWHFAASLNFEEQKSEQIFAQNVEGAKNTLSLAKKIGAKHFIYISTAYTAGTLSGDIPECMHSVTNFNNTYEKSKHLAESVIAEQAAAMGLRLTICRPSIVIGPDQTKQTGGTRDGLYGFLREMLKLKSAFEQYTETVRIAGNKDTLMNFIPVNRVMDDILELISRNFDKPVYHLSATHCLTVGEVFDVIQEQIGITNVFVAEDLATEDMSRLERALQRRTLFYSGYVHHSKKFQRSLTGKWTMRKEELEAYVQVGLEEIAQERTAKRTKVSS